MHTNHRRQREPEEPSGYDRHVREFDAAMAELLRQEPIEGVDRLKLGPGSEVTNLVALCDLEIDYRDSRTESFSVVSVEFLDGILRTKFGREDDIWLTPDHYAIVRGPVTPGLAVRAVRRWARWVMSERAAKDKDPWSA